MDREEAVELYRKVVMECRLNVASVSIEPPRKDDDLSKGYQLHIKSLLDSCERDQIQKIVNNHQLTWRELDQKFVIYKPKN